MMEKIKLNSDIIILFLTFIIIVALITCAATMDVQILGLKTYSVSGIESISKDLGQSKNKYVETEKNYNNKISEKSTVEQKFNIEKKKYEAISQETISLIQDVTKEQKYMIEYLWVVLGDYAADNSLQLVVMEPGSNASFKVTGDKITVETATTTTTTTSTKDNKSDSNVTVSQTTNDSTIKILVLGKYQDIADFVFDVENDKSLKFKLDNISMQYAGSNKVVATFDVLDMSVLMK